MYNYLVNTPGFYTADRLKAYRSLDAYQFFFNGFVNKVNIHKVAATSYIYLKTTVRRSQAASDPYHVWVVVNSEDLTIKGARCQCMAGLGEVCTHVAALLFKVVAATENGLNRNQTCTDISCTWNDDFSVKTRPALLKEINFQHPKYNNKIKTSIKPVRIPSSSSDSGSDDDIWDALCEIPGSSVALHLIQPQRYADTDDVFFNGASEEIQVESTPSLQQVSTANTVIDAAKQYV
ncbi:uncharacterized protein [Ptychodera flava]|uniref:uncharacterized protein n=1 Tax=Ptychodera flava TaxID=63121 RepID=UPI00396A3C4C